MGGICRTIGEVITILFGLATRVGTTKTETQKSFSAYTLAYTLGSAPLRPSSNRVPSVIDYSSGCNLDSEAEIWSNFKQQKDACLRKHITRPQWPLQALDTVPLRYENIIRIGHKKMENVESSEGAITFFVLNENCTIEHQQPRQRDISRSKLFWKGGTAPSLFGEWDMRSLTPQVWKMIIILWVIFR